MASSYFSNYAKTLHRVSLAQLIDEKMSENNKNRQRPSLVFNPVTGNHYSCGQTTANSGLIKLPTARPISSYIPEGATVWDYTPAECRASDVPR